MRTIPPATTQRPAQARPRQLRLRLERSRRRSRWRRWAASAARFEAAAVTGELSLNEARDLAGAAAGVRFANPATRHKLGTLPGWLFRYLAAAGADNWSDVTPEMAEGGAAPRPGTEAGGHLRRLLPSGTGSGRSRSCATPWRPPGLGSIRPCGPAGHRDPRRRGGRGP